jgi:non-ribosomal peptide synthetase component F
MEAALEQELAGLASGAPRWDRLDLPPLHLQFAARAAAAPDAPCLLHDGATMTYGEVAAAAGAAAARLAAAGVPPGATVGVLLERSFEFVAAVLGVLSAGMVYVPLDPALPPRRLEACAAAAQLSAVVAPRAAAPAAAAVAAAAGRGCAVLHLDGDAQPLEEGQAAAPPAASPALAALRSPDAVAYIIFTSGSTGEPKGVACSHLALADTLDAHLEALSATPADVFELSLVAAFDGHLLPLLCPLAAGAALALAPPGGQLDPAAFVAFLRRSGVTVVHSVPTLAAPVIEELRAQQGDAAAAAGGAVAVREWKSGGEALTPAMADALRAVLPALNPDGALNVYASALPALLCSAAPAPPWRRQP